VSDLLLQTQRSVAAGRVLDGPRGDAGGDLLAAVQRVDPLLPVVPPRPRMLRRALEPLVRRGGVRVVGPEVVLLRRRRIDDAGDVAGAAQTGCTPSPAAA